MPRPWIFHPGKSPRLVGLVSAPQKGVIGKDQEKKFFPTSSHPVRRSRASQPTADWLAECPQGESRSDARVCQGWQPLALQAKQECEAQQAGTSQGTGVQRRAMLGHTWRYAPDLSTEQENATHVPSGRAALGEKRREPASRSGWQASRRAAFSLVLSLGRARERTRRVGAGPRSSSLILRLKSAAPPPLSKPPQYSSSCTRPRPWPKSARHSDDRPIPAAAWRHERAQPHSD
jgi:hypothetical protein